MPFTSYHLRNEYGLADPDLYRAADKDDSERLLEAVAMAGLVGLLRQLGDLAEFAAEMFHDLHEEIMATAARGDTLAVRAHQLEAQLPAIEKAFLSQKNHPSFFTNAGIDWHPILHIDQNLITRGDLPRCVMGSFEECWGPPRLFLLDKFDVAGAGTCLKRYTDPSFFKNATDSYDLKALDTQRGKKMLKTTNNGAPLKNGEAHQNSTTSHAKLHELFMEERNGNNFDNSASLVKLKKRQLNGSPFDLRSGKSYMEKFLHTPSPEHKVIYETTVDLPPLKLPLDSSSESGTETVEIGTVSPVRRSSEIKENVCSSPNYLEALKLNKEELNSKFSTLGNAKAPVPVLASAVDTTRTPSITDRVAAENGILTDDEQNHKSGRYVGTPDEVTGEIENNTDASATMGMDTDSESEHSFNSDPSVFSSGNCGSASDANKGQLDIQGLSSDSQLFVVPTVSDDTAEAFSGARNIASEDEISSIQIPTVKDIQRSSPAGLVSSNAIIDLEDGSDSLCLSSRNTEPVLDELHGGDEALSSDAMLHPSRSAELNNEYESGCNYLDKVCQMSSPEENGEENIASIAAILMKSTIIPLEERRSSVLPETGGHSDEKLLTDRLEVMRPANSASEVDSLSEVVANLKHTTPLVDILQCKGTNEQQSHGVHSETSAHLDNYLPPHMSEVSGDAVGSATCGTSTHDDYDNSGSVPSDLIVSPSRSPMISEEHHPGSEILYEQSEKNTERVYSEHLIYSELETDQRKFSADDSGSVVTEAGLLKIPQQKDVSSTTCGTITLDDYDNSGSVPSDLIVSPSRSPMISEEHHPGSEILYEQSEKDTERVYSKHLIYSELETDQRKFSADDSGSVVTEAGSLQISQQKDVTQNSTLTEKVETASLGNKDSVTVLPPNQIHGESHSRDDTCPNSPDLFSGRIQPRVGQEVCFALDEPCLDDLPCQHPFPSLEVKQVKHAIASLPSAYGSMHEPANLRMVEMPPLPPLPPVQWRLGKAQFDSRDSQSDRHVEGSFPLTSEYGVDRKEQFDFSAPLLQGIESRNMYPVLEDGEENQHHYSDKSAECLVQPSGSLVNISSMADDTSIQHSSTNFKNIQSAPSFVVETMSNKRQEYVSFVKESDREGFRRPFSQAPCLEETIFRHYAESPLENQDVLLDPYVADRATEGAAINFFFHECSTPVEDFVGMPINQTDNGQEQSLNNQEIRAPAHLEGQPQVNGTEGAAIKTFFHECSTPVEDFVGMPINQTDNGQEQFLNNQEIRAPAHLEGQPQVNGKVQHPTEVVRHVPLQDLASVGGEMQPMCLPAGKHCLPMSEPARLSYSKAPLLSVNRKANRNPAIKNPTPEDPLIDVFAALDKSRLRKVSKQVRPQVGPMVDERDSWLEQIRTKSFNLRPTGGTRPNIQRIQGPKTNLRIAALLEKANSIRQATAGSDDEGDVDSWSDS